MISKLATVVLTSILVLSVGLYRRIIRPRFFLRRVPRVVESSRLFYGHTGLIADAPTYAAHQRWHAKHGSLITYDGLFNIPLISITDKIALNHILVSHHSDFPKPSVVRRALGAILGEGLIVAEGAAHTRQRKIMNPAFGPSHMKAIFSIFSEKALHLRDVIMAKITETGDVPTQLDFTEYASRVSLDVIASAGFGYETHAIEKTDSSELVQSFQGLISSNQRGQLSQMLTYFFPFLRSLIRYALRERAIKNSASTMKRIGKQLVEQKRTAVLAQNTGTETIDGEDVSRKDLLSILVKANMAQDLKPSQRLTDEEVIAQISTFLLAGTDTTANGISWAIYCLCKDSAIQDKLRAEVTPLLSDHPTYEELNALPYLDATVRETLRVYAPIAGTIRTAAEDSVIPLSEPIIMPNGSKSFGLSIAKGTNIFIPIQTIGNDPAFWGLDAVEFKPERWLSPGGVPEGAMEMPSLKFPTFSAGPRACIGFRFSVMEMKMVLFGLLRVMSFELAVDPDDIEPRSGTIMVSRPRRKSRPEEGYQLPVLIRAL